MIWIVVKATICRTRIYLVFEYKYYGLGDESRYCLVHCIIDNKVDSLLVIDLLKEAKGVNQNIFDFKDL